MAPGTKCAFSSALYAYGSPWRMPHSRSPSATARTTPTAIHHGHRRSCAAGGVGSRGAGAGAPAGGASTTDIGPVVAGGGHEGVAGQRQRVLDVVGARLVRREALAQERLAVRRVHRDAAGQVRRGVRVATRDHVVDA